MAWNSAILSRPAPAPSTSSPATRHQSESGRRYQRQVEESQAGEGAGENQQEGDAAAQHDAAGEARGDHDADGQAEEVVADGDEIGQIAMVAPGGQNGAQQGQQKTGERGSRPGRLPPPDARVSWLLLWCCLRSHCFDCIIVTVPGWGNSHLHTAPDFENP